MLGDPKEGWRQQGGLLDGWHRSGTLAEFYFVGIAFKNVVTNQMAWSIWSFPQLDFQEPYPRTYWVTEDERFLPWEYEPDETEKHAALETVRKWKKPPTQLQDTASSQSKTHQEQCILKSSLISGPNLCVALNGPTRGAPS
jgi:hypothetical protein